MQAKLTLRAVRSDTLRGDYDDDDDLQTPYAESNEEFYTDDERFFFQFLGACRRRAPRTCVGLKVPNDASHRDLSDAILRFDLALGARRWHVLESCLK